MTDGDWQKKLKDKEKVKGEANLKVFDDLLDRAEAGDANALKLIKKASEQALRERALRKKPEPS